MGEISDRVQQGLKSWLGVTVHDHNFGGLEFRVNGKEMGHMHGDEMVDLPFPKADGRKLIAEGKASPHHFIPQSAGVVSSQFVIKLESKKWRVREYITRSCACSCTK